MDERRDFASRALSVAEVVTASGYSAQQIRDLERIGVILPAPRAANGYRQFGARHIEELRAYRELAYAVGAVEARRVMRAARTLTTAQATAEVGQLFVNLAQERERALAARDALVAIRAEAVSYDDAPARADSMSITELSTALGVRPSALRHWERMGLVHPERIAGRAGAVRSYHLAAIRQARITAALRASGYRIPEVQRAIRALGDIDEVDRSLAALDSRLVAITDRTLALMAAAGTVGIIIQEQREGVPAQR